MGIGEVFSSGSVHGLYSSEPVEIKLVQYSTAERLQLVSNGKGRHKSWLQQWLQSWSSSLQRKRIDSIVVSYKVYTL
jgi:hypothetical protein